MSQDNKELSDDSIVSERKVGRRSALAVIGGAVAGAVAMTAMAPSSEAHAQSDSDSGRNADPAGRGRTGRTDSDSGRNSDRAGHGRGRACSDSDGGRNADPAGRGRHC